MWVRRYVEREGLSREALLPGSVQLRKEIDRLPETLRALRTEQAARDAVRELNLRVVEYLRNPVGPRVKVGPIDADDAVAAWRAGRTPAAPPAASAPPPAPAPWWRRRRRP